MVIYFIYRVQGVHKKVQFSPPDRKAKVNLICGHPVYITYWRLGFVLCEMMENFRKIVNGAQVLALVLLISCFPKFVLYLSYSFFPVMDDDKSLADYGLTAAVAKAQQPAEVGVAFRGEDGGWEELEKTPYSIPPELPDVMKPGQDSVAGAEQTCA